LTEVKNALGDAQKHPNWANSGYSKGGGPRVEADGCSSDPYFLRPGVDFVDGVLVGEMLLPLVETASPYRLFVFAVSEKTRDTIIKGELDVRRAPQEVICADGTCTTITTGIYVTDSELADKTFLSRTLAEGLELAPPRALTPDKTDTKLEGPVRNPVAP
jgi:hypothetical protein